MKKSFAVFTLFAAILLFLSACSPKTPEPAAADVELLQPGLLIAEGRLMPVNSLAHSFALPGQLAEVLVSDGETVQAGQVLARLVESPETATALARANQEFLAARQALEALQENAELNLAQSRVAAIAAREVLENAQERVDDDDTEENQALLAQAAAQEKLASQALSDLEAGNGIHPDQLAAAEARLASAEAALASAQAAAQNFELTAAIAGTVVDLDLQPGQRVSAGQPVLTLGDFSGWVIKTDNLSETDVVDLQVGQKVTIRLDALPEKALGGEITHINARYEEKRGDITYTVTISLTDSDPLMRWGMTAAVEFVP